MLRTIYPWFSHLCYLWNLVIELVGWDFPTDPRPLCRHGLKFFFKKKDYSILKTLFRVSAMLKHLCNQTRRGQDFFDAVSAKPIHVLLTKGFTEIAWCDPQYNPACCTVWNVICFMILPDGRSIVLMPGRGKDHSQQSVLFPVTWSAVHAGLSRSVCTQLEKPLEV